MREKLDAFLRLYPVTIVYPIPRYKWLIWIDEESGELHIDKIQRFIPDVQMRLLTEACRQKHFLFLPFAVVL